MLLKRSLVIILPNTQSLKLPNYLNNNTNVFYNRKKKFSVKDVTTLSTAVKAKKVVDALNHDESSVLAARQLHIVPSSDGMGFFLRSRNKIDGERHFSTNIKVTDKNSCLVVPARD